MNRLSSRVYKEFGEAKNFFSALESLNILGVLQNIELSVLSKDKTLNFEFNQLSEGERQMFTVLGLILITGQDDCLFLLDEPDTHLNPNWQRGYIKLLEEFNLKDKNSHIIIASHSPLLVQSAEHVDTFLFKLKAGDKRETIVDQDNHVIRNWRIDQVFASEYFDFENTRTPNTDEFVRLRKEILSKSKLSKEDLKKLEQIEDEHGSLPTGETTNEIKALNLIDRIIKRAENNDKNK